jgi:hypothetical protein
MTSQRLGAPMFKQPVQHWTMKTAIEQVQKCGFECEGGPLANNDAWTWLAASAEVGPEYWPGQGIYFEVEAEAAGKKLSQWVHFYIVGCRMDSDNERRFWVYDLSYDPPGPWHYGTTHFTNIKGERMRLALPERAA